MERARTTAVGTVLRGLLLAAVVVAIAELVTGHIPLGSLLFLVTLVIAYALVLRMMHRHWRTIGPPFFGPRFRYEAHFGPGTGWGLRLHVRRLTRALTNDHYDVTVCRVGRKYRLLRDGVIQSNALPGQREQDRLGLVAVIDARRRGDGDDTTETSFAPAPATGDR